MPTTDEEFDAFALLVKNMRQAQNKYFRTRGASAMHEAKLWESRVDFAVGKRDLPKTEAEQLALFGGGSVDKIVKKG